MSRSLWPLACAVVAFGVGAALATGTTGAPSIDVRAVEARASSDAAADDPSAAVVSIDADGFRYAYHVTTGTEALFDLRDDPRQLRDVLPEHPELAKSLRRAVEERLHVESLDALRRRHADTIRRLQSLGYL